jgi:hypothetical protein
MVTDRGPNGLVKVDVTNRRTFPVPEFTPLILKVRAEGDSLRLLQTIPIVGQSGRPVTGLPNLEGRDEPPYDFSGQTVLPYNPSGLDTEGIVHTSAGEFWLSEEYGPSIVAVDKTGRVVKRFVPRGLSLTGADYPIEPALPAIFAMRRQNRGFEGLSLSRDEKSLYAVLQGPLNNPDLAAGAASFNTRVLVFDIPTETVTAEYLYRLEPSAPPDSDVAPEAMQLCGVVALNASTLLILERTDELARLYTVDLAGATNILGTEWDNPATSPSLEQLDDPALAGIAALPKSLVIDLATLEGIPPKLEGVAVIDRETVAVANDNDFDIAGGFDEDGNLIPSGSQSQLLIIHLARTLPGR